MNGFLRTGASFKADVNLVVQVAMGVALIAGETVTCRAARSMASIEPTKLFTRLSSLRTGLTIVLCSKSAAATSGIVVTRDQCHLKVIVSGQQFFQSKRCVHTAETTAEDEYTLGLRSGGRRSRFFHIALASYAEIGPGLTYYDAAALRRVS